MLADNGGPTQTMAPLFDSDPSLTSPLIDAGYSPYAFGSYDQLGSIHRAIVVTPSTLALTKFSRRT